MDAVASLRPYLRFYGCEAIVESPESKEPAAAGKGINCRGEGGVSKRYSPPPPP